MRSLKLHIDFPFALLFSLQVLFSEIPKFLPLTHSFLTHDTAHPPSHLSVSIFKCLANTRRGNKGQMPVCDLCLDLAKHDVWIRCMEWKFPWQRDCKAGRGVTYSFSQSNRTLRPPEGCWRGSPNSEFSSDYKNLWPHCLFPHPLLLGPFH